MRLHNGYLSVAITRSTHDRISGGCMHLSAFFIHKEGRIVPFSYYCHASEDPKLFVSCTEVLSLEISFGGVIVGDHPKRSE